MAAFGEHNYATPLGAIPPSEVFGAAGSGVYPYSGWSSRSGATELTGQPGQPPLCGTGGMEFLPYSPTLTFPLNCPILQGLVRITWKTAVPADPCNDAVTYELQFTRSFTQDEGWKTLASNLPSVATYYDFDVAEIPYTADGGLRIRAKDNKNLYSLWSTCNEPFIIANHAPNPVTILAPFPGEAFDFSIPLIWREPTIADIDGQVTTYRIEVTDRFSANMDWTVVSCATSLPRGTTTFDVPASDLPEGLDFGIRIFSVDSLGLYSEPKTVGPLKICHEGVFIIDTLPPEGSMSINDGAVLAANAQVRLSLFASDATTGIKDVRFKNAEDTDWGSWDSFANEKFWTLPATDGVKRVLVQFRDYAGNVSAACDCEIVSRVFCNAGNVTDIEVFNDKLYAAFDAQGNVVEYKVLVKTVAQLNEPEVTALAKYGNYLYIATYDGTDSSVYSYAGLAVKVFGFAGTKILTMQAFLEDLFIGTNDNKVSMYNGTITIPVLTVTSPVTRLRTDGATLFAALQNTGEFWTTIDGISWKQNFI